MKNFIILFALLFIGCDTIAGNVEFGRTDYPGWEGVEWYTDITPANLRTGSNPFVSVENDRGKEYVLYTSDYPIKNANVTATVGSKLVNIEFATSDGEAVNGDWLVFDLNDLPIGWTSVRVFIVADTDKKGDQ
jgi:hypothetical protein